MERSTADKTQHQAAFSAWIVRILFQQFSMLDYCRFAAKLTVDRFEALGQVTRHFDVSRILETWKFRQDAEFA
jgi:hypothetical protein